MTKPHPTLDQPDNYKGTWGKVKIQQISVDTTDRCYHLSIGDGATGSYCTQLNPVYRYELQGRTLTTTCGDHYYVGRRGLSLGHIINGHVRPPVFNGNRLNWCPNCLTMAAVEAEMLGQNAYKIQGTLNAMAKLPTPQAKR